MSLSTTCPTVASMEDKSSNLCSAMDVDRTWDGDLVTLLIQDQARLTAVERFSQKHSDPSRPVQEKYYRQLLPASPLRQGQQWAFEVDLDSCSGCKACVSACHSLNGLEDKESWRDVGLLLNESHPFPNSYKGETESCDDAQSLLIQHVTTACHHCVDPGCLNGCPVLAYEKDPITGVVWHLDDQCIGCQYCIMKCPYDVPKYSKRLGIVRKCDMCRNRLEVEEAPACVQACPTQAIRIRITDQDLITDQYRINEGTGQSTNSFLPDSPDPGLTLPTTLYRSKKRNLGQLKGADHFHFTAAESHLPLVWMLVLTQASVGSLIVSSFITGLRFESVVLWVAFLFCVVGLGLATLHLGRPERAWKSFLGWRKSWFSREVIAFGGYISLLSAGILSLVLFQEPVWTTTLLLASIVLGGAGILSSAMIYIDTSRTYWKSLFTFTRFVYTTLSLGLATTLIFGTSEEKRLTAFLLLFTSLLYTPVCLLVSGYAPAKMMKREGLAGSQYILSMYLNGWCLGRCISFLIGGLILPALIVSGFIHDPSFAVCFFLLCVLFSSEWIERYLFFRAVVPYKMPGGIL